MARVQGLQGLKAAGCGRFYWQGGYTWRPMGLVTTYNWASNPTYNPPKWAFGATPVISRVICPVIRTYQVPWASKYASSIDMLVGGGLGRCLGDTWGRAP